MQRASFLLATLLVLPIACVDAPQPRADAEAAKSGPTGEAAPSPAAADAAAPAGAPGELTPEEIALIEADPKTLSKEQNRKRAYALRKKIMQDPESGAAKALEEAREAALAGQLPPEQVDPNAKKDEGLVIELPEHLKDQRVSKGEPDLQ